ncbi:MAG: hypothetical protein ACOVO3_07425 [Fluviicola sp.]
MCRLLIKVGKEEHLRLLQKEGLLYCGSVLDFAKMENDPARGDKYENVSELELLSEKEIWLKPSQDRNVPWKGLNVTYGQMRIKVDDYKGNIFCMGQFPLSKQSGNSCINIDSRFLGEFGKHYLLILDQPEFFRRIHKTLDKAEIRYERGVVSYDDLKNFTGIKSTFLKDNSYSWQSEYRIFINTGKTEKQEFRIGNIEDITLLGELNKSTVFKIRR